ncbi:MAG: acyltransferase family protein [Phycisphaerales bacterium]|nr:MAG: acyltransferase family protein [Phycisphaerales bacterium]
MPQPPTSLDPPSTRVEALDALRAGAMVLGVLLHASVPYMHAPMRGLLMPVNQPATGQTIDAIFWSIHTFRMPLFFFISGLVSVAAIRRRGVSKFIRGRWTRVGLPLLIGAPALLFLFYPIWLWGWIERGWTTWRQFRRLKQNIHVQADAWGLYHFWFLEYLLIYGVGLWLAWLVWDRLRSSLARRTLVDSDTSTPVTGSFSTARDHRGIILWLSAVVVAALPLAMLLHADPQLFTEFRNSFLPDPSLLTYYAIFYVLGCFCRLSWLGTLSKAWPPMLLIGIACSAWVVSMMLGRVDETAEGLVQATIEADGRQTRWEWCLAISGLAMTLGLVGLVHATVRRLGPVARFLVDSSYWVYLTHVGWVGLVSMLIRNVDQPPGVKAAIVMLTAVAGTLLTFLVVRRTRLIEYLGSYPSTRQRIHNSDP